MTRFEPWSFGVMNDCCATAMGVFCRGTKWRSRSGLAVSFRVLHKNTKKLNTFVEDKIPNLFDDLPNPASSSKGLYC